jgi:glycosyltransferase involved in cell wall biosynthesis
MGTTLPPIVCISNIDWDFLWQRHQILMSGLAQRGTAVAFIEKLDAARQVTRHDWRRLAHRAKGVLHQFGRGDRATRGVRVITPAVVPHRLAAGINRRVVLPRVARRLRDIGFDRPVVWTYSFGPNSSLLERLLAPRVVIYDCVNRLRGYAHATPALIEAEDALVRRADLVVTDSAILWAEKKALNPRCVQLGPGADFELFAPEEGRVEPAELARVRRPRLGFFGSLDDRLDQATLAQFAISHSEWSVVLIGPSKVGLQALTRLPNVVAVGTVPHAELGCWLQGLDVIAIPYLPGEFTRGIIPAKLFEALATGRPLVATGLPELEPYRDVITLCDAGEFAVSVEAELARDTSARRERRMALAQGNSWASRIDQATRIIAEACKAKGRAPDLASV